MKQQIKKILQINDFWNIYLRQIYIKYCFSIEDKKGNTLLLQTLKLVLEHYRELTNFDFFIC